MAAAIFSSAGGSTTGAGVPAPYPSGSLVPPLTVVQKVAVKTYLNARGLPDSSIDSYINTAEGSTDSNRTQAQYDAGLVKLYELYINGGAFHKAGPGDTQKQFTPSNVGGIGSVVDFLKLLAKGETWVRVGEFAIGAVLVGIGVNAMLKGKPAAAVKSGVTKLPAVGATSRAASFTAPAHHTSMGGLGTRHGSISYDRVKKGPAKGEIAGSLATGDVLPL